MMQNTLNTAEQEVFVFPASFTQTKLWFLDQLQPNSSAYNIHTAYRFTGVLNVSALEQSLIELIRRHESLRTTFAYSDESPQQLISPDIEFSLEIVDLKDLPETQREIEAQSLAQQEAQQPFNLANDSLFRVKLLRIAPEDNVLLVTMHHIISDGWSMGVFKRELATLYQAFVSGQPSPLPDLPIQYADFAVGQRDWLQGEVLETLLAYWKQQLGGHLPTLELPTDLPRPLIPTDRGAAQFLEISPTLAEELQKLSQRCGVTLFMTLLAAFKILLYRYTGQEDIIIGTPISGRNRIETEGLIGFFANTLALRTNLSGNPSFQEFLARVREVFLGAYAHQEMPFEKLVAELQPERDLSRSPVFQVMFSLQNTPKTTLELPGLTLSSLPVEQSSAKFDLTLGFTETTTGIQGKFIYNIDLFDSTTIDRMIGHYLTLLEGIVANPSQTISELPLLTEAERNQILVEWNNTAADYPENKCIHQLFEEQVDRTPDAVAVQFEDQQLTYRELNGRANQLAHYLQELGVKPEVLVGICVDHSIDIVVGLLGIFKAGGAYVPIDPNYPRDRVDYILLNSQVTILITQKKQLQFSSSLGCSCVYLDEDKLMFSHRIESNCESNITAQSLAYVIYTSGTTGKPKGVAVEHQSIVNFLHFRNSEIFTADDLKATTVTTSICFDASVAQIFSPLIMGGKIVIISQIEQLFFWIDQEGITCLTTVPSLLEQLLKDSTLPSCVRVIGLGGEAMTETLLEKLVHHTNVKKIMNLYGPTETTITACTKIIYNNLNDFK